jgi:hypothetical protein
VHRWLCPLWRLCRPGAASPQEEIDESLRLTGARHAGSLRAVGKHDRRNSMKMKRRKAQVKKKTRLKRQSSERKAATTGAKKPAARKKAAPAPASASAPPTTPTGTAPGT